MKRPILTEKYWPYNTSNRIAQTGGKIPVRL